jgi:hypothetical protein
MALKNPKLQEHAGTESRRNRIPRSNPDQGLHLVKPAAPAEPAAQEEEEEDVFGVFDVPFVADGRSSHEPDPHAVDDLTDRIFGSVLSRYGWERHEGRIEHVGEPRPSRR